MDALKLVWGVKLREAFDTRKGDDNENYKINYVEEQPAQMELKQDPKLE